LPDVKISPVTFVVALAGVLFLGAFGWLTFGPKPTAPPTPQLTAEGRAYLSNLKLSGVHMQAAESYAQGRLIEILGDVTNTGERPVKLVEVTCVFRDYSGQVIARERVLVVGGINGDLKQGQKKAFRLPFDTIPDSWNQALPSLVIAQIQFE